MRLFPYGESAVFCDLELEDDESRMRRTHAVARALSERLPSSDVVVGTGSIVVVGASQPEDFESLVGEALALPLAPPESSTLHVVRAIYDGPDLAEVTERTGLSRAEIIELHASRDYLVEIAGFLPGFAYLGPLDPRLVLPRRPAPRARVERGCIGIAGTHTGIYPLASPGGWNLIARAVGLTLFDASREPPILFLPGDRVRFEPADD